MDSPEQWRPAPKDLSLPDNVVHVWRTQLSSAASDLLSDDERQRAAQFHFERDRNRYIAGRSILRQLIGRYQQVPPETIHFIYNTYGKPALENSSFSFNVSHSGDLALLAFARDRNVGVDIECIRPDFASAQIATQFFSETEIAALRSCPAEALPRAFFTCWTRKEAFIKAHGSGLSLPLHHFAVSIDSPPRLLRTDFDPQVAHDWTLHDLDVCDGFLAALATEGRPQHIHCWQW